MDAALLHGDHGVMAEPRLSSILLIVPFFGRLPSWSELHFRSCAANPTVNWLLVSDQAFDAGSLPANVRTKRMTLAALKQQIDALVGFETVLPTAYKLCDFRPLYGFLFADDLHGFDFWGHCDMDVIFGDIRHFLPEATLNAYDKVLIHGHLSLYRNTDAANNYFRLEAPGLNYREVFTSPESMAFDEFGGIRQLLDRHGIEFFRNDRCFADLDPTTYKLNALWSPNYKRQCFYWEGGKAFRAFWTGTSYGRDEYAYIHFQRRPMEPAGPQLIDAAGFYVTPNGFVAKAPGQPDVADMRRFNPTNMVFDFKRKLASSIWHLKRKVLGVRPQRRPSSRAVAL